MTALGIALLLLGATLVVAEAHVPGGVLGIAGGVALIVGGVIVIAALGGSALVAVPVVAGLGLAAGGWALLVTRKAAAARRERIRAGSETLPGRIASSAAGPSPPGRSSSTERCGARAMTRRARRRDDPRGRQRRRRARQRPDAVRAPRRGVGAADVILALVIGLLCLIGAIIVLAAASVRVLREYERGIVFRLGRVMKQRGPGLILLVPGVDRMVRVSLRTVTLRIPAQEVITRDNVPARVTAVGYYRIVDPMKSVLEVQDVLAATAQISQTTLRSVLGKVDLDALLSDRERLNEHLQQIIDDQTEPWGVKVTAVEIKGVEIPDRMQHAIARQAEAERERRAKIINADGEYQAAARLTDAADVIARNPVAIQLRYLQTLMEVSGNQSSTIVLPMPLDVLQPLVTAAQSRSGQTAPGPQRAELDEALGAAKASLEAAGDTAARLGAGVDDGPGGARQRPRLRLRAARVAALRPGSGREILGANDARDRRGRTCSHGSAGTRETRSGCARGSRRSPTELEQVDGFTQAFFLTDAEHSRAMSITLWDSYEALEASAERAHSMRTQATEPADATIESVESYEVVLTAQPAARGAGAARQDVCPTRHACSSSQAAPPTPTSCTRRCSSARPRGRSA